MDDWQQCILVRWKRTHHGAAIDHDGTTTAAAAAIGVDHEKGQGQCTTANAITIRQTTRNDGHAGANDRGNETGE